MAKWKIPTAPSNPMVINNGRRYVATDPVKYSDLNLIVENLLYQKSIVPQLLAPKIQLDSGNIVVEEDPNGVFTQVYFVYLAINPYTSVRLDVVPASQKRIDLSKYDLAGATTHDLYVVCGGAGTYNNAKSNTVSYYAGVPAKGQRIQIGNNVYRVLSASQGSTIKLMRLRQTETYNYRADVQFATYGGEQGIAYTGSILEAKCADTGIPEQYQQYILPDVVFPQMSRRISSTVDKGIFKFETDFSGYYRYAAFPAETREPIGGPTGRSVKIEDLIDYFGYTASSAGLNDFFFEKSVPTDQVAWLMDAQANRLSSQYTVWIMDGNFGTLSYDVITKSYRGFSVFYIDIAQVPWTAIDN